MPRPIPTYVVHFTRVENLLGMLAHGLVFDNQARANNLTKIDIGHNGIKENRRRRKVPCPPGGVVADYVPFYYAPRSPMMYRIKAGNVPTYQDGCDRVVYLVSSLEQLTGLGIELLMTDRNAALAVAAFADLRVGTVDGFIDWALMREKYWNNTDAEPDRKERRMAECLAYQAVPWDAVLEVAAMSPEVQREVQRILADAGQAQSVNVRRQWYF